MRLRWLTWVIPGFTHCVQQIHEKTYEALWVCRLVRVFSGSACHFVGFAVHRFINICGAWRVKCRLCPQNLPRVDIMHKARIIIWAPSSEFVSLSIPSWQISTVHAQPFRGARDLASCLKVPLDSLLVWASSEGSGETARMRRLAWTFASGIGDKY